VRHVALVLMFSGCATAEWTLPMMEAPSDVPFCDGAPVKIVDGEGGGHNFDMLGVKDCTWLIKQYPGLNDHAWDGVIDFRLTVDDDGSVSDICVKGGNFGNVPDYVSCIASKARQRRGLPPGRHDWRLRFIMD
jgi:hypothetical protein